MEKISKETVLGFYMVLVVITALSGFFIGKSNGKEFLFTFFGVIVGLLVSLVLWLTWGSKNTY